MIWMLTQVWYIIRQTLTIATSKDYHTNTLNIVISMRIKKFLVAYKHYKLLI